ncbi:MAG: penicillin-binding protein 1A [Gammaproteobacteria bacterium]|nr:penicillin-binding protein 1A [Gammaproteobacteria bacterium]MBU1600680.1 penicillin-binding protein 1A [Gammaproteobacteria bacterium]MBU2435136.1 penicillin-binding protein 1A [Gammaproteobacteria bacterium]MBU2448372.1 penicillin-binding protein 1A [Gammaproteobacteria bacterium]
MPSLPPALRLVIYPVILLLGFVAIGVAMALIVLVLTYPNLPSLEVLTDYRPKIPLRVYTADGFLIGEYGEERRAVVAIGDVPAVMKNAILAAEDDRFYQHGGIDYTGVVRAMGANLIGGGKRQGASTITQQVARNFFLTGEKTYTRKLYEALLSFKIESNLSKDQIFELYINQIFLGQRAYGFAAAAKIYFGKPLKDISIAEAAMLAGLPKAPSAYNPIVNPSRARQRQHYVLRRMRELGHITETQHETALKEPLVIKRELAEYAVHAEYVAEMARQITAERFPEDVYSRGMKVYTTIIKAEQDAAYNSLRKGVLDYDRRHGYRGAESFLDMKDIKSDQDEAIDEALQDIHDAGDLIPGLVLAADARLIKVYCKGGELVNLTGDAMKFAARMLDDKAPPNKRLKRGAIVRLQKNEKGSWQISQLPEVESAFVAVDPKDGAIRALVGGFDFNRNKFNHVTLAWRQPGSSFKPFIYSASLEKGYAPNSIVADEPIIIPASQTGAAAWEPHNYDGKYEGPMRMRTALAKSKNMVSIRILEAIGTNYAQDYATRFGFDAAKHPPYLTMALGAGSVTPWQMVSAYSVFANGGFRVNPFVVREIRDDANQVLALSAPTDASNEETRVIDPRNAFLMDSMLRDVTIYGTAAKASAILKRHDLAGKTGTTNEYLDAWFCGYQMTVSGCAWIGFDQPRKLGDRETGGAAALPIWIGYMSLALKDVPTLLPEVPAGLVATGEGRERSYIYVENVEKEIPPAEEANGAAPLPTPDLTAPPTD